MKILASTSPQRDSLVKSIFEETRSLGSSVKVSNADTTTTLGDSSTISILEQTTVIPPEVLMAESISEEV